MNWIVFIHLNFILWCITFPFSLMIHNTIPLTLHTIIRTLSSLLLHSIFKLESYHKGHVTSIFLSLLIFFLLLFFLSSISCLPSFCYSYPHIFFYSDYLRVLERVWDDPFAASFIEPVDCDTYDDYLGMCLYFSAFRIRFNYVM